MVKSDLHQSEIWEKTNRAFISGAGLAGANVFFVDEINTIAVVIISNKSASSSKKFFSYLNQSQPV